MKSIITVILLLTLSMTVYPFGLSGSSKPGFVTPPAPKFTDGERQAELARRRANVVKNMAPDSVLILWSAEPRNYAGDVDFMYRQENNLYYLTNLRQKGSALIIAKTGEKVSEYLFLPPRDPRNETWNGRMYSTDDGVKSNITCTWPPTRSANAGPAPRYGT